MSQHVSAATSVARLPHPSTEPGLVVLGDLPQGWTAQIDRVAVLLGPRRGDGPRPELRLSVSRDAAGLDAATQALIGRLVTERPDRLVAGCDIWPHVRFGEGRYVQTAHVEGPETLAHDVYLFTHEGLRIQVEVDCRLVDLLHIEEQVASIVGRLAVETGAGA
ncbi:hypothetical protein [Agilicoccus flavus]|uniref:hypothetical protein n=1 Tax=Agilicoccus flavus TaxID=2775968 RepID=UPI001CF66882|nr:hypothetical protein [Agilicoccus flavus]